MWYMDDSFDCYRRLAPISDEPKAELRHQLREKSYVNKSRGRIDLAEVLRISEHRFVGYTRLVTSELQKFIEDRKLVVVLAPSSDKPTRRMLAEALIKADRCRAFDKLFNLPTELREMIGDFYISDFFREGGLLYPSQPPLTRTCRLLREEVLPLFFRNCKPNVAIRTKKETCILHPALPTVPGPFRVSIASLVYFSEVLRNHIADVRALRAVFFGSYKRRPGDLVIESPATDLDPSEFSALLEAFQAVIHDVEQGEARKLARKEADASRIFTLPDPRERNDAFKDRAQLPALWRIDSTLGNVEAVEAVLDRKGEGWYWRAASAAFALLENKV